MNQGFVEAPDEVIVTKWCANVLQEVSLAPHYSGVGDFVAS